MHDNTKKAVAFLNRLKKLDSIIENCELKKAKYEEKALNTTSGGVSVLIENNGKEELHNMDKVQSTSCGMKIETNVTCYVDLENRIAALKAERESANNLLEQLEAGEYDTLYKFYILEYRLYEIANIQGKSYSTTRKLHEQGLKNLQKRLNQLKK